MARIYLFFWLLIFPAASCLGSPQALTDIIEKQATQVQEHLGDVSQSYQQCEALYEEIRNSACAKTLMGFLGRVYLKVGLSFTERQVKFQDASTDKVAFALTSGLKPRPIFSVSLSDSYFEGSNWGYSFGFSYFDDYAFEQVIQRGSGSDGKVNIDLGTYSSMGVIALSPTLFYSWGRGDDSPNRYGKAGLGLNLMYSNVRGTAYLTEVKANQSCYDLGTTLVEGAPLDLEQVKNNCEYTRFRESSYGTGFKLYVNGNWNHWESEVSVSIFNHRSDGDYRFSTQEVQLAFSRKFEF